MQMEEDANNWEEAILKVLKSSCIVLLPYATIIAIF